MIIKDCERADEASKKLLKYALDNGSRDNTTVLVLRLK